MVGLIPFILLLGISPLCAAAPFADVPEPTAGSSMLASLASEYELERNPAYANYDKRALGKLYSAFILGQREGLKHSQVKELHELLMAATAADVSMALCFNPRHYFRYTSQYGMVEALLCFECGQAAFTINGWRKILPLDAVYEERLNELLKKHAIPEPVSR